MSIDASWTVITLPAISWLRGRRYLAQAGSSSSRDYVAEPWMLFLLKTHSTVNRSGAIK